MSKKITLTHAHRIRKALEAVVSGYRDFGANITINAFSDNAEDGIAAKVDKIRSEFNSDVVSALRTIDVLYTIRSKISKRNTEVLLTNKLDEQAHVEARIRVLTRISNIKEGESLDVLKNRVKAMVHAVNNQSGEQRMYGNVTDSLTANVADKATIQHFIKQLVEAKKEQRIILDTISGLNSTTFIEISDEDAQTIDDLGIV